MNMSEVAEVEELSKTEFTEIMLTFIPLFFSPKFTSISRTVKGFIFLKTLPI